MSLDLLVSVVLYHNSPAEITKLISSCNCPDLKINLTFVDNAPAKQSFDFNTTPDWVSYLPMEQNLGFGAAHNRVILGETEALFHLILNPDIEFKPAILTQIVNFLYENSEVKLLMPKIVWPSGKDQGLRKLLPQPSDLLLRRFVPTPFKKLFHKKEAYYQLQHLDASKAMKVPVLSGCFMFCPQQTLREIGGFDERFFLYLEDVDLARRLGREGTNLYWPEVSVIHHYQKSSYRSIKPLLLHLKSAFYYFSKYGWLIDPERQKVNRLAIEQKQG